MVAALLVMVTPGSGSNSPFVGAARGNFIPLVMVTLRDAYVPPLMPAMRRIVFLVPCPEVVYTSLHVSPSSYPKRRLTAITIDSHQHYESLFALALLAFGATSIQINESGRRAAAVNIPR